PWPALAAAAAAAASTAPGAVPRGARAHLDFADESLPRLCSVSAPLPRNPGFPSKIRGLRSNLNP
ncbi:MAG: hypothetical protein ACK53V_10555, partial [Planctomycetota bacterium]